MTSGGTTEPFARSVLIEPIVVPNGRKVQVGDQLDVARDVDRRAFAAEEEREARRGRRGEQDDQHPVMARLIMSPAVGHRRHAVPARPAPIFCAAIELTRGADRERGHLDIVPELQRRAIGSGGDEPSRFTSPTMMSPAPEITSICAPIGSPRADDEAQLAPFGIEIGEFAAARGGGRGSLRRTRRSCPRD